MKNTIIEKFAADAINAPATVTGGGGKGGSKKKSGGNKKKSGGSKKKSGSSKSGGKGCNCPPPPCY